MADYPNFYENLKEATMRLQNTVVMYDREPYNVVCIADHKPDGIFRVYLEPIGTGKNSIFVSYTDIPYDYPDAERGVMMDEWMKKYPDAGLIRKQMNSPHFNKFRPFDLGMCNYDGRTYYLERTPQRHTQQGLTQQMVYQSPVTLPSNDAQKKRSIGMNVPFMSPAFRSCVLRDYPSFKICRSALLDPDIVNDAVAFDKNFALVRGPIDTLFLAYKEDIVASLPNGDETSVHISPKFKHTKEVISELNLFKNIVVV